MSSAFHAPGARRFSELRLALERSPVGLPVVRVAILGDGSTQFLAKALAGQALACGWSLDLFEADPEQSDRLILNPHSALYDSEPEFVILSSTTPPLEAQFRSVPGAERGEFARQRIDRTRSLLQAIRSNGRRTGQGCKVIHFNFPLLHLDVLGNYSNKTCDSFTYQLRSLNQQLMDLSTEEPDLFILDVAALQSLAGVSKSSDPKLLISADLAFTLDFTAALAFHAVEVMRAVSGRFRKCLILDLDNTLWGGVVGDDGMANIEIGSLGIGGAFSALQHWAKELRQRGILLAVCSKNDEAIAKEPFESHPDMVLRLDDIAVFVANWNTKVDNIRHIQSILNIGFDAMVFVDDNPFEREMVRGALPALTVPDLPEDPADYAPYLRSLNLFETASCTETDVSRTRQYQVEAERRQIQKSFASECEFLGNLDMRAVAMAFDQFSIPRVAQLSQRSNQFNLRTVRYTEDEVRRMADSPQHRTLAVTLEDRLGAHGLIAAVILERRSNTWFVDTWLMSCRVLKRGVEHFTLNKIVSLARETGVTEVVGEYLPTAKNGIVAEHYADLGFVSAAGGSWHLNVENYTELKTPVHEESAAGCPAAAHGG